MSARILVVDDILTNVKLLEAKLRAEYFEVLTATSGQEALDIIDQNAPDIILLDVMMPKMDGFEVCRRIKNNPETQHIPIIMVTALDQASDKLNGLEAGADDFLTKPVNDIALLARVKSLVRLKIVVDELRMRTNAGEQMGVPMLSITAPPANLSGRIMVVEDDKTLVDKMSGYLTNNNLHNVTFVSDPKESLYLASSEVFDLVIISLDLDDMDGLRLCSQLRSLDKTRSIPILVIVNDSDTKRLVRALDLGVNNYISQPVDGNELLARVRSSLKRKWYSDQLRQNLEMSMELAIKDSLTGMHNRRYIEQNLSTIFDKSIGENKVFSLLLLDIDFFKKVNDNYGHDIGDEVLKEFAFRICSNVRGIDMTARLGGEEFLVLLPDTDKDTAKMVAERLRVTIADDVFTNLTNCDDLNISMSIGVASLEPNDTRGEDILKRSDMALYSAKKLGRNRVEYY